MVKHKKNIAYNVLSVIGISSLLFSYTNPAFAEDLHSKKQEIHSQQTKVQSQMSDKQNELSELQADAASMKEAMDSITSKVNQTNQKMDDLTQKISDTNKEMDELKQKISDTKKRIAERNDILKKRARSMQVNGSSVGYLDVLMGSESFGDFIDRALAVSTVVNADHNLLEEQKKDKEQLQESEQKLVDKMNQLQEDKKKIEDMKIQLKYEMAEKEAIMKKIKEQQDQTSTDLADLQNQSANLSKQEKEVLAEEKRQAELARKRAEAARIAKTSHSNDSSSNSSSNSSHESISHYTAPIPAGNTIKKGSGAIETAISAGSALVGHSPYNWGGGRNSTDIANRSFDCSSFVRWAYDQAGVDLGGITSTSTNTLVRLGKPVSASSMKRGDLVFFDTYKTNGHVGIYLGNGKFLDDNSSDGVSIDSMSNPYWQATFNGIVRRIVE
ncbi:C40 family peptidase [Falsibacillus albus]|uniref:Peptidase C40 n=1 Tax=Falsibacillus albus TaxID=2478915 RepID=A0A3L7JUN2_9BACI|nr:NlpC/P60 family protein [Falsibacillus albus]RLQ94210.1 peptidase C40 [Falsibacillus albus]